MMELTLTSTKQKIEPGMAIPFEYTVKTAGEIGTFSNFGTAAKADIPEPPGATPDGTAYFVCVGYDYDGSYKFVCDRVLQTGISWETLNAAQITVDESAGDSVAALVSGTGLCTSSGMDASMFTGVKNARMRLLHSGVTNGQMDRASSEWDAIIFKGSIGETDIPATKVSNWNYGKAKSWMMDTPSANGTISDRVARGTETKDYASVTGTRYLASTDTAAGFRPVLTIPVVKRFMYIRKGAA